MMLKELSLQKKNEREKLKTAGKICAMVSVVGKTLWNIKLNSPSKIWLIFEVVCKLIGAKESS